MLWALRHASVWGSHWPANHLNPAVFGCIFVSCKQLRLVPPSLLIPSRSSFSSSFLDHQIQSSHSLAPRFSIPGWVVGLARSFLVLFYTGPYPNCTYPYLCYPKIGIMENSEKISVVLTRMFPKAHQTHTFHRQGDESLTSRRQLDVGEMWPHQALKTHGLWQLWAPQGAYTPS